MQPPVQDGETLHLTITLRVSKQLRYEDVIQMQQDMALKTATTGCYCGEPGGRGATQPACPAYVHGHAHSCYLYSNGYPYPNCYGYLHP